MFTTEEITAIAALPANAYKFKHHIEALLSVYRWVREQWTAKAVKDLAHQHGLDLRKRDDRAKFGWFAAQELAQSLPKALPASPHPETKTVKFLCQAIALLPPVPQTNGLEKTPAYQILGEPIYADELHRNYKQLIQKWHPDNNPSVEAVGRFQVIDQIYKALRSHWFEKYSPLIPLEKIGQENLEKAKAAHFDWSPESFWV